MGNLPVKYGLWAGIISIIVSVILYFLDKDVYLSFNVIPQYIIQIYFMVYVVSLVKRNNNDFITFNEAFKSGWLTFILSTTIIALYTYLLFNHLDTSLNDQLKLMQEDAFATASKWIKLTEEQRELQLDLIRNSNPYDLKSLAALPVTYMFPGAIIAAIIALIKRNAAAASNITQE